MSNTTKIRITVWKESGKYYTHDDVDIPAELNIWQTEFRKFIWEHRGATCADGFITVQDIDSCDFNSGFHTILLRSNDLIAEFGSMKG